MKHLDLPIRARTAVGCLAFTLLSACGGSSYHPQNNSPPPAMQGDAFTSSVQSTVSASPEDVEPVSIDALVATQVEDQEPASVM